MPSTKTKIVYSLRVHVQLQQMGFAHITEMKNPGNQRFNCWVYAATPEFEEAFELLMRQGVVGNG